jgi:ketosteroid isomerase-like protein
MAEAWTIDPVPAILDAFAIGDGDEFARHLTDDVVLRPSAFITGRGEYRGRADVREGFAEMQRDLADRGESAQVTVYRQFWDRADEARVLTLAHVTITRANGDQFGTEIAYLWRVVDGKVAELAAWLDHDEGLSQLVDPVEVGEN